jgi:tetratricopeptide (TPR) repeat protein
MTGRQSSRASAAATARALNDPIEAALALRANGRLEEALEALSRSGDSPDSQILGGDLLMEMGRIEDAAGSYSAAIAAQPGNIYAHHNLGICLRRLERWRDAAAALQKALEYDPHRDQVRIYLGDCLLRLNRLEEALDCFDRCWSEAARGRALFGKGVVLQLLRRFDEAEAVYTNMLAANPNQPEALTNLIAMSMEVFDLGRVHRYSQQLLDVSSQSTLALQGLTLVALERREYENAAYYFSRFLEHTPVKGLAPNDGEGAIEYRLSQEVVDRLNETWRSMSAGAGARPNSARNRS